MVTQRIDYSKPPRFNNYHCASCAVGGVKLWRLLHATNSTQQLRCVACAASAVGINIVRATPSQLLKVAATLDGHAVTPAIPADMDGGAVGTYWGLSSALRAGLDWWRSLPLMKRLAVSFPWAISLPGETIVD